MTDPTEVQRYRLPDTENRRIFTDRIVPDLLAGRTPQDVPTVVFLVGQPGAGKSRVTELVAAALNRRGGFVDVDSDLYKPYHPAYAALLARDDTLMAAYTRADGRAWMARAEDYIRTHHLNAVIQETSQNAEAVAAKMHAHRDAGARVEALFMAVPQAMSNQGIINRYFEQLADRGQGRLTVQANADESYLGILALAELVDRSAQAELDHSALVELVQRGALADLVTLYRRGESQPRYSNSLDSSGRWVDPPALRQALDAERARTWTAQESDAFVTTQLRLWQISGGLGPDWQARLIRIEQQAAPLMPPEAVHRLAAARAAATAAATFRTSPAHRRDHSPSPSSASDPQAGPQRPAPQRGPDGPERGRFR